MDIIPDRSDQNRVSKIANIAALSIGTSAIVLDGGIAAVTLPTIAKTLGISDAASVVIITGYQLILVSTILPFAALAGRVGFQNQYRYGQSVFFAATLLLFFVDSLAGLILVRLSIRARSIGPRACPQQYPDFDRCCRRADRWRLCAGLFALAGKFCRCSASHSNFSDAGKQNG
jgi:Na+/melibiose symporter-like transporter